ncbi:MAG: transketolase family protein [Clostridia bacterium]|nr:transketolase family protein [Clostridia bacterium]
MADKLMKEVFTDFVLNEMAIDPKRVLIDADLKNCIGSGKIHAAFPDRAFNVGIAEQNMVGIAAGLSAYGFKPIISSFGPFATRRVLDQIMISLAYAQQNCIIVGTDPGITAELNGGTHMPFEDVGALRSIPNIVIYEPTDIIEFDAILPEIMKQPGLVYIRMHRKTPPLIYLGKENRDFSLFKADVLQIGNDVTLIANGIMVQTALLAAQELEKDGISAEVICCHTVKPIDTETIIASVRKTGAAVTCENHNVMGALRSAVCETICENYPVPVKCVGVKEKFGEVGKVPYLRDRYNMNVIDIVNAAKESIALKK